MDQITHHLLRWMVDGHDRLTETDEDDEERMVEFTLNNSARFDEVIAIKIPRLPTTPTSMPSPEMRLAELSGETPSPTEAPVMNMRKRATPQLPVRVDTDLDLLTKL
ncbi:hypothetical protein EDB84DRAFT_1441536 [Lactarius hengduanensis]|nr:hypothetical protein EDB84DRAFT_1441536 [Lactarius hengduanensis]